MQTYRGLCETKFQKKINQRFKERQESLDINTCVPILVELLKEKDMEIAKLRKEIDQVSILLH